MPQREYAFWLYASKGLCLMTVCPRGTMPYDCMPRREMPFDRMPKYRGAIFFTLNTQRARLIGDVFLRSQESKPDFRHAEGTPIDR